MLEERIEGVSLGNGGDGGVGWEYVEFDLFVIEGEYCWERGDD